MRKILFRAKAKENCGTKGIKTGDWVYGYYCPKPFSHFPCDPAIYPIDTINNCYSAVKIDVDTLGQHTGLTDKQGKMIFEGDIVEFEGVVADCEGYHDNVFSNRSVIEYIDGSFIVCGTDVVMMSDLVYKGEFYGEVIGNIYDNPDLMEVEE